MDLATYKRKTGINYSHIAFVCDVTTAMISEIAAGRKTPSFSLAVKIEKATGGCVPRDNWYPPRPADITITVGAISV